MIYAYCSCEYIEAKTYHIKQPEGVVRVRVDIGCKRHKPIAKFLKHDCLRRGYEFNGWVSIELLRKLEEVHKKDGLPAKPTRLELVEYE